VLVNGASGGVGLFVVQLARSFGAEVTGVCSTRNVDLGRSLGAERVVDHTREDFTAGDDRYDVLIDNVGNRTWSACRRVLTEDATVVLVGGPKTGRWLGPLRTWVGMRLAALGASQRLAVLLSSIDRDDLQTLGEMVDAGTLRPVIDRIYPLRDVAGALGYVEAGQARAKVVVVLEP
jgi:NADPH:quinone reductase-like Zn-dependent oxidoreductase